MSLSRPHLVARVTLAFAVLLVCALRARPAAADGAFPASAGVLVPAGLPHGITLATNFGVIKSQDDGATWTWSCEQDPNGSRDLYQYGAASKLRLFARDATGLVFTDDGGCTWTGATGSALTGSVITDAFPDPTDPMRVVAAAAPTPGTTGPYHLIESSDGGTTFGTVRYTAAAGITINSVEISRSDPHTIYLVTLTSGTTFTTKLLRSTDSGATWTEHDISGSLGSGSVLIIAVDPTNPMRVFLRVSGTNGNKLGVTEDGGATFHSALDLTNGLMSGFALMSSGTILVSGVVGVAPVLYRSTDHAVTFNSIAGAPNVVGLAARGTTLFGAGQAGEAFAVGTSADEGTTWTPLMNYGQVAAIDSCVKAACQDICQMEVDQGLWEMPICSANPPPPHDASTQPPSDAGAGGAGGAAGTSGAGGSGPPLTGTGGGGGGGGGKSSGCELAAVGAPLAGWLVLLLGAAMLFAGRRRRS